MAGEITTTLVVNFQSGTGEKGFLAAAIDSRSDGFNLGKTTFTAGDQPVYLITRTTNVVVESQIPSFGTVAFFTSGIIVIEQDLQFANTREARLQQPAIPGTIITKWIGSWAYRWAPTIMWSNPFPPERSSLAFALFCAGWPAPWPMST